MERPDSWYEQEDQYDCNCGDDSYKKLENAREFLESVVEMMYSKEKLNMEDFESHLEEACSYLDIGFPMGDIQIKRK